MRSQRERKVKKYDDFVVYFSPEDNIYEDMSVSEGDPISVKEAISGSDKQKWIDAMTN